MPSHSGDDSEVPPPPERMSVPPDTMSYPLETMSPDCAATSAIPRHTWVGSATQLYDNPGVPRWQARVQQRLPGDGGDHGHRLALAVARRRLQRPGTVVGPLAEDLGHIGVGEILPEVQGQVGRLRCHARGRLGVDVPLDVAGVV